ncbi:Zn-ribbon domain-containing OB-fold protein [Spongiactinospora sp. TRM90649]|uniref:Zn-ribbon domain-containing OB-fold protein n=1 Tax=Spongiactinospora sp. TRM90649 TaxID=3031114 RepID=UPI0023F8EF24|nr:Zn-ribbon domain-containing OB-fold protein [Spongiactinospora sp. TRM90649]MDF5757717.1 Zn-ribbon domain-containing OB-fold protein [Spongiactinospora sp. TRM90649]
MSTSLPEAGFTPAGADEAFWAATAEGRLTLTRCEPCATVIWYPRPFCPQCGGRDLTRFAASGEATVYSYTVVRKARGDYRELTPYVVAYVELAEGPRILTNIVGCDPAEVRIGQAVTLVFDPPRPDDGEGVRARLYRFRPKD